MSAWLAERFWIFTVVAFACLVLFFLAFLLAVADAIEGLIRRRRERGLIR